MANAPALAPIPDLRELPAIVVENLSRTPLVANLAKRWTPAYHWYSPENKRVFAELLAGLVIAAQHQPLHVHQCSRYTAALEDTITKDLCDRTAAITAAWGYDGHRWHASGEPTLRVNLLVYPDTAESVEIEDLGKAGQYVYYPLEQYRHQVPPVAMVAMARLEATGMIPDTYNVAVLEQKRQFVRDPLLCARFGNWLIAIAHWE